MERPKHNLDRAQRYEGLFSSSAGRVSSAHKNFPRACVCGWVSFVLKKRNRIIAKVKSKYWVRTHKFGIRVPQSVAEAKRLDEANGDTLWWDAICKEMKSVRIAFEEFEGDVSVIPQGYQEIRCHMIFDIKMGENFRRKARMVADGHWTETPAALTVGRQGFVWVEE